MKNKIKNFIVLVFFVTAIISCNKDEESGIPDGQGRVKTSITDGPFPFSFVTEANVGVTKIEVKTEIGEFVVLYEGSASYNMVNLTNGVTAEVETTNIEVGIYTEARITIGSASVSYQGGGGHTASIDGNTVTVNIHPAFVVEEGENSEILFDVDLNSSFSFGGLMGGMLPEWITSSTFIGSCSFNPHIKVCDFDRTGRIEGSLTVNGANYENAHVYYTVNRHTFSTHTEADGSFTFIGINAGTYTVHVETENGDEDEIEVTVSGTGTASCNFTIN